jgi:hypothetical protein
VLLSNTLEKLEDDTEVKYSLNNTEFLIKKGSELD